MSNEKYPLVRPDAVFGVAEHPQCPHLAIIFDGDYVLTMGCFKTRSNAEEWADKVLQRLEGHTSISDDELDDLAADLLDDHDLMQLRH